MYESSCPHSRNQSLTAAASQTPVIHCRVYECLKAECSALNVGKLQCSLAEEHLWSGRPQKCPSV